MEQNFQIEDGAPSRRKQGKRSLAVYEACMLELKQELKLLLRTYEEALSLTNERLASFAPDIRARTLEAAIVQSCFAEVLFRNFEGNVFWGRHKRLILRVKGYLILFKKLDSRGYPMNIKTVNVQSILNQSQVLDLFTDTDYDDEPILYLGYQKNRIGEYVNPQLVYIDDSEIKFTIVLDKLQLEIPFANQGINDETNTQIEVKPKLKGDSKLNKAN